MPVYEAYGPPQGGDISEIRLIRDGRNWAAFAFGPAWLLINLLWLEFAFWLLVAAGLVWFAVSGFAASAWLLAFLPAIYLLLEGNRHVARRLARHGWRFLGVVEADCLQSAEMRWHAEPATATPAQALTIAADAQAGGQAKSQGLHEGLRGLHDKPREPDDGFGLFSGTRE